MSSSDAGEAKSDGEEVVGSTEREVSMDFPLTQNTARLLPPQTGAGYDGAYSVYLGSIGPGESKAVDIHFSEVTGEIPPAVEASAKRRQRRDLAESRHRIAIESSASVGDRRNRFPWGIAFAAALLMSLALGGALWALWRVLSL